MPSPFSLGVSRFIAPIRGSGRSLRFGQPPLAADFLAARAPSHSSCPAMQVTTAVAHLLFHFLSCQALLLGDLPSFISTLRCASPASCNAFRSEAKSCTQELLFRNMADLVARASGSLCSLQALAQTALLRIPPGKLQLAATHCIAATPLPPSAARDGSPCAKYFQP